ncbi:hypothetical protein [Thioclava sp. GXIMD4215]|uniref:hypothetical protein n=1 Tax=Thioclava sp. GXIMD4215 TaxID=3131928 RepID=UPI00324814EA
MFTSRRKSNAIRAAKITYLDHLAKNRPFFLMGLPSRADRIGALRLAARAHNLTMDDLCPHVGACTRGKCKGHKPSGTAALPAGPKLLPST